MLRALSIKLYPNNNQVTYLNKLFGCYRKVYNICLDKSKKEYNENNNTIVSLASFSNYFHREILKNNEYEYLKEHNTKILKDSINNLSVAFKNYFKHQSGYPRFKSRDNEQKIGLYNEAISKKVFDVENKMFISKKFGYFKYRTSDEYRKIINKHKNNIKRITLVKTKSGDYFARVLIETNPEDNKVLNRPENEIIGLDMGIKDFIVTSNNDKYENIKIKRNNHKKIAKLHRELSRKQKGSSNRNKSRIKLAKYYEKLNNRKENYLHQITNRLLDENQVIVIEDLAVNNMLKNHNLARSLQELSLYSFKSMLEYKSQWYGRDLVKIDRWFPSSKLCSNCGYKNKDLELKDRTWTCPDCNEHHDRDYNAALNIRNEGARLYENLTVKNNTKIGHRMPKSTPLESSLLESL